MTKSQKNYFGKKKKKKKKKILKKKKKKKKRILKAILDIWFHSFLTSVQRVLLCVPLINISFLFLTNLFGFSKQKSEIQEIQDVLTIYFLFQT